MRFPIIFAIPFVLGSGAAQAMTSTASIRLVMQVPVKCSVELLDLTVTDKAIFASVHRQCNTSHRVTFSTSADPRIGKIRVIYGSKSVILDNYHGVASQREGYYDGVDRLVIESIGGSQSSLSELASSLRVGVDIV